MQKGVAVHDPVTEEFRLLKTRNHGEDPFLLAPFEACLKAHQVEHGLFTVFGPQLDGGKGPAAGPGINEAHRLHRAERHDHPAP